MNKFLIFFLLLMPCCALTSCEEDEPYSSSSGSTNTSSSNITRPSYDKNLSTSDFASFSIRVRFKTGGDKESNLRATVYWKSYSSQPLSIPSKSELTKVESMRQYGTATYYKTGPKKGMTESIVFDKSHAGYGGSYIYYYVECENSKGSASSPVTYLVTRR